MTKLAYKTLIEFEGDEIVHSYTDKDTILYALAMGYGSDPTDREQLKFVYEDDLAALPSMVHVLGMDSDWILDPANGINVKLLLHGETGMRIHKPLPPSGTVASRLRIVDIVDKGPGKGALLYFERAIRDASSGDMLATVTGTFFLRGDGGFGGPPKPAPPVNPLPDRAPDASGDIPTLVQAALLYRLNGDHNALHADPNLARSIGFDRPILHGLALYGVACRAAVQMVCGNDPTRLKSFDVRYSAPIYPGETVRTDLWHESDGRFSFRCTAIERDVIVLSNGLGKASA